MPLQVTFEEREDVWIPMFERVRVLSRSKDCTAASGPGNAMRGERAAVISGVGQSEIGRRLYRDPRISPLTPCLDAVADAGLTSTTTTASRPTRGTRSSRRGSPARVVELQDALRLELDWFAGGLESPGQLGSVISALQGRPAWPITSVCSRTVWEASVRRAGRRSRLGAGVAGRTGRAASCSGRCRSGRRRPPTGSP